MDARRCAKVAQYHPLLLAFFYIIKNEELIKDRDQKARLAQ
jgi:hypothetical protein